jgi:hypothetical protein
MKRNLNVNINLNDFNDKLTAKKISAKAAVAAESNGIERRQNNKMALEKKEGIPVSPFVHDMDREEFLSVSALLTARKFNPKEETSGHQQHLKKANKSNKSSHLENMSICLNKDKIRFNSNNFHTTINGFSLIEEKKTRQQLPLADSPDSSRQTRSNIDIHINLPITESSIKKVRRLLRLDVEDVSKPRELKHEQFRNRSQLLKKCPLYGVDKPLFEKKEIEKQTIALKSNQLLKINNGEKLRRPPAINHQINRIKTIDTKSESTSNNDSSSKRKLYYLCSWLTTQSIFNENDENIQIIQITDRPRTSEANLNMAGVTLVPPSTPLLNRNEHFHDDSCCFLCNNDRGFVFDRENSAASSIRKESFFYTKLSS